jgi:hypothetical protein
LADGKSGIGACARRFGSAIARSLGAIDGRASVRPSRKEAL